MSLKTYGTQVDGIYEYFTCTSVNYENYCLVLEARVSEKEESY